MKEIMQTLPEDDKTTVINVNHIHIPTRKEFMSIKELTEQIPYSKSKIFDMIKNGEFIEEVHFTRLDRKILFYFPEVVAYLKPKNAKI